MGCNPYNRLSRGNSYSNSDAYRYRYRNGNTGWDTFAYPSGNADCYSCAYSHGDTFSNSHGNRECYSYRYTYWDTGPGLHGAGDNGADRQRHKRCL